VSRTPTLHAPRGMVCSVDHLASSAGVAMLRAGGSAADAAVAANAVLAVTTPNNCGLGGDLFALVHDGSGDPVCLDAAGRAGSGADAERLRREGATEMPFHGDIRSVTVPGCVDGWVLLHQRFGRLPLADVLAPAIRLAEEGFPASPLLAATASEVAGTAAARDLLPDGRPPQPGRPLRRPGVARTLRAIADGGRAAFYQGEFGEGLLDVGGGEFTAADLATPQARWVTPLHRLLHGHVVWTPPPPSQGYLTLLAAAIAEHFDLGEEHDPRWVHLLVEAAKAAGHDRLDALSQDADGPGLVAAAAIDRRRSLVRPDAAARLPYGSAAGDTVYLCAVDGDRMGVSLIQSNASGYGSGIGIEGLGILLHNRGIGFSLQPGHPAAYGPGRRPPHTLAPALVTDAAGGLHAVTGTMGGDSQPQIVLQLLTRLFAGASAGAMVGRPRWQLTHATNRGFDTWKDPGGLVVSVEPGAPAAWVDGLRRLGHTVREGGVPHYGHAHAIVRTGEDLLAGASDHRSLIGAAVGW
jgi:gamma-glutamyltranspeptidase / glutathione hydrolase